MIDASTVPHDIRDERGSALVIAMIAMGMMLMLGLATLALTDQQTRQSGVERFRESSFNLAEGALQQQSYLLGGRGWPKLASDALPVSCTLGSDPSDPLNRRCPTPTSLVTAAGGGAYDEIDYKSGVVWTTKVRDNSAVNNQIYTDAIDSDTVPRYDANGDGFIWVKSTAKVGDRPRTIVALLKRDPIPIFLPKGVLVAGALEIGQGGQPGVITSDTTSKPTLRCPGYGDPCADYEPAKPPNKPAQIVPDSVEYNASPGNRIPDSTLQQLLESGTTYSDCPSEAQLSGVVVIDVPDTKVCSYQSNAIFNTSTVPGIVIMKRGTLEFKGTAQFYGMLVHLNLGLRDASVVPQPDACIRISGTNNVYGGIVVEGKCGAYISGNARLNYSPNNLNFSVTGVAGLVQNTWRELPSS